MMTKELPKGRVLVRGSINIDEFFTVPHIVHSGETISSTEFSRRGGGKGANQAVSAAKAGASVDFAGFIGNDGSWLRDSLAGYGVGVEHLGMDPSLPTGRAIIQLSTLTRDNSIVLLPGANHSALPLPFPPSSPTSSYSHLLLQNEIPLSATRSFLNEGCLSGLTTLFNPSPMLSRDEIARFAWAELDWLLVNEGEGRALLKALRTDEPRDLTDGAEKALLKALAGLGGEGTSMNVVLTKGGDGIVAWFKGTAVACGPGKVVGGVKDTTGAGDCFTGFFAALLASHPPNSPAELKVVLSVASAAAAMCVEVEGAMESVPTLAAVKERMGEEWPVTF